MSALSVEFSSSQNHRLNSNTVHSREAEIFNLKDDSTPKENITITSSYIENLFNQTREYARYINGLNRDNITTSDEREATKAEAENDAVASKAFILTKPERVPENTSALSVEALFLILSEQSKLLSTHNHVAEILRNRFKSLKKETYFYTAKLQKYHLNT
jgi:hypothetical protein